MRTKNIALNGSSTITDTTDSGLRDLVKMRVRLDRIIKKQEELQFVSRGSLDINSDALPLNDFALSEIRSSLNDVDELLKARASELPDLAKKIGSQKTSIDILPIPFKDLVVEAVDKITSFPADVCADLMDIKRGYGQTETSTEIEDDTEIVSDTTSDEFESGETNTETNDLPSEEKATDQSTMLSVVTSQQKASAVGQDSSTYPTSQNDNDGFEESLFDDAYTLTNTSVPVLA